MKKKIVIGVLLVIVLVLLLVFLLCDKSEMIAQAYRAQGFTVTTETLDNQYIGITLASLPEEQLEKISEYKILYAHVPEILTHRAVVVVFPSAGEARSFLKDCGGDLYQEMRQDGKIQGNCVLFSNQNDIKDIFKDYWFICILDKIFKN